VLLQPDGSGHVSPRTLSRKIARLMKDHGSRVRLHGLRHSHASILVKAGEHPKVVQERLGHASISITMDTYSHVMQGIQEQAAAKLDDVFVAAHRQNESKNAR
jgi:integrase